MGSVPVGMEFDYLRQYSEQERRRFVEIAQDQHAPYQAIVDWIWQAMDLVDRSLMLMSWAMRPRSRNATVHHVPTISFAQSLLDEDQELRDSLKERASEILRSAKDWRGNGLFAD